MQLKTSVVHDFVSLWGDFKGHEVKTRSNQDKNVNVSVCG